MCMHTSPHSRFIGPRPIALVWTMLIVIYIQPTGRVIFRNHRASRSIPNTDPQLTTTWRLTSLTPPSVCLNTYLRALIKRKWNLHPAHEYSTRFDSQSSRLISNTRSRRPTHADARGRITAFSSDVHMWVYTCVFMHRGQLRQCQALKTMHDLLRCSRWRRWHDVRMQAITRAGVFLGLIALLHGAFCVQSMVRVLEWPCVLTIARKLPRRAHTGQALSLLIGSGTGRPRRGSAAAQCCGRQSLEGAGGF